jgi:peptide methionine sulfoxide reductase MsrB
MKEWNILTPEEERVIVRKGTERAFTGEYTDNKATGIYTCRRIGDIFNIIEFRIE